VSLLRVPLSSLKAKQMMKDEETRALPRKKGYRVLELCYRSYSNSVRDEFFRSTLNALDNIKSF
jgi:hypothetical protein